MRESAAAQRVGLPDVMKLMDLVVRTKQNGFCAMRKRRDAHTLNRTMHPLVAI